MQYVVICVIAYLIGSVNFSIIFTKRISGFDVREKGSGNAGSTNVLRTAGPAVAILTLVCDILKGVAAVGLALLFANLFGFNVESYATQRAVLVELAGIFVIIGHTFPVFFQFKGGKGVATALGVLLVFNWKIGLICLTFALIIMIFTKMVSLGSIGAAALFPVLTFFIVDNYIVTGNNTRVSFIVFGIILALLVVFNHRTNIERIINKEESRISFKK